MDILPLIPNQDEARALLVDRVSAAWAPFDQDIAFRQVRRLWPKGHVLLFGASTHTRRLIESGLNNEQRASLSGVIDSHCSAEQSDFAGLPLVPPEHALRSDATVVICHPRYSGEMRRSLKTLRLPAHRILSIPQHPDYWRDALAEPADQLMTMENRYRTVVFVSDEFSIFSNDELSNILPADSLAVHFGDWRNISHRTKIFGTGPFGNILDLKGSFGLLRMMMRQHQPNVIYLRTMFRDHCLGWLLRRWCRQALLVHEMYDFALMLPDDCLCTVCELSGPEFALSRWAEADSLRHSSRIVSKRGGPVWNTVLAQMGALERYRMVFQQAHRTTPPAKAEKVVRRLTPTHRLRIMFASFLPRPSNLMAAAGDLDVFTAVRALEQTGRFEADLFNARHLSAADDEVFKDYLDGFPATGMIRYHRAIGNNELRVRMNSYDFGWLFTMSSDIEILDKAVSLSSRFVSFMAGGLPVLVDDSLPLIAELVMRFKAGIVVPQGDLDALCREALAADHTTLKAGTQRLWSHMVGENEDFAQDLGTLIRLSQNAAHALHVPPMIQDDCPNPSSGLSNAKRKAHCHDRDKEAEHDGKERQG